MDARMGQEVEAAEAVLGQYRDRMVGEGYEDPEQLLANPKNWKIHPHVQERALHTVLSKVGWVTRIVVNRHTGFILDGHGRVLLAVEQQEKLVPVQYVDITEEEEDIILATFDSIGNMAGTDAGQMVELMQDVIRQSDEQIASVMANLAARHSLTVDGLTNNPDIHALAGMRPDEPVTSYNESSEGEPRPEPQGLFGPGEEEDDEDEEDEDDEPDDTPATFVTLTVNLGLHPEIARVLDVAKEGLGLPDRQTTLIVLLRRMDGKMGTILGQL